METKDILKSLRKSNGYSTMQEFCAAADISFSTYQNYESGKRVPTAEILVKLADLYGVTTDYLLGRPEANPPESAIDSFAEKEELKSLEKLLLKKYLELSDAQREAVLDFLRESIAEEKARQTDSTHIKGVKSADKKQMLVILRKSLHRVSAGTGYDLNDPDAWENIAVMDCMKAREADYLLEIDGDSMEPTYKDGDYVYVKQSPDIPVGAIGVFFVDGCGYIKERGNGCLISHNSSYDPIPLQGTENRCIGLVLGVAELQE